MKVHVRTFALTAVLLVTLMLAACKNTSSNLASIATSITLPAQATVAQATVATARVTVKGMAETVLTDAANRKTLYYLTVDTATKVICTGTCAHAWPPLILTTGTPTSASPLPHRLSVLAGPNGRQVEYDGHPLYTFSGDSGPGQAMGEGIQLFGGTWHVVTPNL
jgi:predicted lipoprotein with Yx(FWY)xxD motif